MMNMPANAIGGESPTYKLTHIDRDASVLEASKLMRKSGTTELLVVDIADGMHFTFGIVTANDIVTRVVAAGLNPAVLTTGDIVWPEMAAADTPKSTAI